MSLALIGFWLTGAAHAGEAGASFPSEPAGTQSACDWILDLRSRGAPMSAQIAAAASHRDLFTRGDFRCLKRADVPRTVVDVARGRPTAAEASLALEAERQRAAEELARHLDVELVAVLVGPAKAGGRQWDGFGTVDNGTMGTVLQLAGAPVAIGPAADIAALGVNLGSEATEPPDVFGYAEFLGPDEPPEWQGVRLSLRAPTDPAQDTLYANFPGSPAFRGVRAQPTDSVRITLYDADLMENDLIGVFDIGYEQLMAARAVDGLTTMTVADQTQGQVLYVAFKVRRATSLQPSIAGTAFRVAE